MAGQTFCTGGEKLGVRAAKGRFRLISIQRALLAALTTLSEPDVLENSPVFGGGDCWFGLSVG